MSKVCLCLPIFILIVGSIAALADDITIIYSPAGRGKASRYWYGRGRLNSEVEGNFVLNLGDARIVSFSSHFTPLKREGKKIYFANSGKKNFETLFLVPKPTGHGLYKVSFALPEISQKKSIKISLEAADKIFFPSIDFTSSKEGEYLVLKATTDERNVSFRFLTKLAYMLFADTVGAGAFTLMLLGYVVFQRRKIKEVIKSRIKPIKAKSPFGLKKEKTHYELSLALNFFRSFKKPFGYHQGKLFVRVPFWLISGLIIVFLAVVFFFSITNPLGRVWGTLGGYKAVITFFAVVLAILATLLLISAKTDKELALRFGIIGGGIIGSMFGYLGIFALVLAATTCLLIYFLSVLLLEEE